MFPSMSKPPAIDPRTPAAPTFALLVLATLPASCTGTVHLPNESNAASGPETEASAPSLAGDGVSAASDGLAGDFPSMALGDVEVAAESVLASMADGRYREGFPWVKVNEWPFPSAVADGNINVWVSGTGAVGYAEVAPTLQHEGGQLPAGTVIVREVLDRAGDVQTLTLMLKGPDGYNPELGDFWFGITDPAGTPLLDEATNEPRVGKMEACYGCHVPRADQGYLFGAPENNRMPYLSLP